jgi:hypothetical protein
MKKNELGGIRCTHWEKSNAYISVGRRKDYLGNQGVEEGIILKCNSETLSLKPWTGFSWLRRRARGQHLGTYRWTYKFHIGK